MSRYERAMTPRQVTIIQASFVGLLPIPDRLAARFYTRLFQMAPETRTMFKGDMGVQGRKLVDTLATVVNALNQVDAVLPAVLALGRRHRTYGVLDDQYELVGLALVETLREMLGLAFTAELEQAWRDAYALVAAAMMEA